MPRRMLKSVQTPSEGQVHIWILTSLGSSEIPLNISLLSPDEKQRASRLLSDRKRRCYVRARTTLRHLLGRYLDRDPSQIQFQYGPEGKPSVVSTPQLEFNLSHSGELAVFSFSHGVPLGVDVERMRPLIDMEGLAMRFFSPEEVDELLSLPAAERQRGFFNCWTRKEAFVKALGVGFSFPLHRFAVTLRPNIPPRLKTVEHSLIAGQQWELRDLEVSAGYAAALAYAGGESFVAFRPEIRHVAESCPDCG